MQSKIFAIRIGTKLQKTLEVTFLDLDSAKDYLIKNYNLLYWNSDNRSGKINENLFFKIVNRKK